MPLLVLIPTWTQDGSVVIPPPPPQLPFAGTGPTKKKREPRGGLLHEWRLTQELAAAEARSDRRTDWRAAQREADAAAALLRAAQEQDDEDVLFHMALLW